MHFKTKCKLLTTCAKKIYSISKSKFEVIKKAVIKATTLVLFIIKTIIVKVMQGKKENFNIKLEICFVIRNKIFYSSYINSRK